MPHSSDQIHKRRTSPRSFPDYNVFTTNENLAGSIQDLIPLLRPALSVLHLYHRVGLEAS
jgi:hypothetical protein